MNSENQIKINKERKGRRLLVEVQDLKKTFTVGRMKVNALKDASFVVERGEFIALSGASGAGKSTLLQLLGGLEQATTGRISIDGAELVGMNEDELTLFRRDNIGFVFQFFNLIPTLNAIENVVISHMFESVSSDDEIWKRAVGLLEKMKLSHRLDHRPAELSGGEQQRVAIARALLNRPKLLLADEPTGNIDTDSGKQIMELFAELKKDGTTLIVATHDVEVAGFADRVLTMKDGELINDK